GPASVRSAQPISNAGFSKDISRLFGISLDLLPKLAHVDAQILRVGEIVPQLAHQEFVREHFAGMLNHNVQEIGFFWRELDLVVADSHNSSHQIDREIAHAKDWPLAVRL